MSDTRFTKIAFPLADVYGLLEPGPVILLTTCHQGRSNVMTLSWLTMLEFEPPLVGCVVSNRDHSFAALEATGECAINIPTAELAQAVVGCGNTSGADTDKFATFGLTRQPASQIQAPLLAECFASLECRVVDSTLVPRYGFFVLEVLEAWRDPALEDHPTLHHRGHGAFMLAGETIHLPSKMK
ncbi:MAG TPA: flavin reductase family protein [Zoogloea sp.]|uniref:flavin reductase family protein n=1 Tax=Zoogloea sp. TaxID=49181 RepID=UPI002C8E6A63|nr:flavin reductase family protein [Zoogloea sp.]HOB44860.1 flavin reductase family protein [Zoogloea sp.]HQA09919.1 flavin reductase family protein [Zoogloea sp.]HQE38567.1 flavin reductase family protein [Zoogloea sp.]